MRAVTFGDFGAPDVLQATRGRTAGARRRTTCWFASMRPASAITMCFRAAARFPGQPGRILGHEIAGEIVAAGANVPTERMGERVVLYQRLFCGTCRNCLRGRQDLCRNSRVLGEQGGGGYAEFTCVPARNAIPIPDGVDMTAAALAVCPIGTSVRAALGVAAIEPGNIVLITGAGGGLGLHQIQVAKSVQARVIAVTSSEDKAEIVRQAGADEVIISPDLKFSREVWRLHRQAGRRRRAGERRDRHVRRKPALGAQNATVVVLGNIGAQPVEIDPGLVIVRRIRIAGSGNATFKDVHMALHLLATGAVKPFIGRVLPFPQASKAMP